MRVLCDVSVSLLSAISLLLPTGVSIVGSAASGHDGTVRLMLSVPSWRGKPQIDMAELEISEPREQGESRTVTLVACDAAAAH
jgi:hypothetical protein